MVGLEPGRGEVRDRDRTLGRRQDQAVRGAPAHRHAEGARVLPARRHPALRAAAARRSAQSGLSFPVPTVSARRRRVPCCPPPPAPWCGIEVRVHGPVDLLARQGLDGLRIPVEPAHIIAALHGRQDGARESAGGRQADLVAADQPLLARAEFGIGDAVLPPLVEHAARRGERLARAATAQRSRKSTMRRRRCCPPTGRRRCRR